MVSVEETPDYDANGYGEERESAVALNDVLGMGNEEQV